MFSFVEKRRWIKEFLGMVSDAGISVEKVVAVMKTERRRALFERVIEVLVDEVEKYKTNR